MIWKLTSRIEAQSLAVLAALPQARQRQGGVFAGDQAQVEIGRLVRNAACQRIQKGLILDMMKIIQHQNPEKFPDQHGIDQRGYKNIHVRDLPGLRSSKQVRAKSVIFPAQGSHEVSKETPSLIIGLIQREPGRRRFEVCQPPADQDALAIPWRPKVFIPRELCYCC